MRLFGNILFQILFCIGLIVAGHVLYEYIRDTKTNKVTKNLYYTQVEKYKNLVEEIQQEYQDKKSMEDELFEFVDELAVQDVLKEN